MSFLSRKRCPAGAIRLSRPGFATFECGFCTYRAQKRTSPNALAAWAKARGAIGAHIREKHAEELKRFEEKCRADALALAKPCPVCHAEPWRPCVSMTGIASSRATLHFFHEGR